MKKNKLSIKSILNIIGKTISWAFFILLVIAAVFLLYYYIATKIYAVKGAGYEPKFSIYTIISESMTPNINKFDAVINIRAKSPEEIKVGDVITFISTSPLSSGLTVTHRVIGITKDENGKVCYQTKGDFNKVADDACAKYNNVLGKVIIRIPYLGRVQKLLASKAGWLFLIMIPALIIITKDILRMTKLSDVKEKAAKISSKPEPNEKKIKEEQLRKEELKKRLLNNDDLKTDEEPKKIPEIEKENIKKANNNKKTGNNQPKRGNQGNTKKKKKY